MPAIAGRRMTSAKMDEEKKGEKDTGTTMRQRVSVPAQERRTYLAGTRQGLGKAKIGARYGLDTG